MTDELSEALVDAEFPTWERDFGAGYWTMKPASLFRLLDAARNEGRTQPDIEAIKREAYREGWNDREDDLLLGVERVTGQPAASGQGDRTYTQAEVDSILRAAFPLQTPAERQRFLSVPLPQGETPAGWKP